MQMRSILLLVFGLSCTPCIAQQVTFTASTNAKQVTTQTMFQVTFTLENARGTDFQPPEFRDFDMISGPAVSQSTSIINGRASSSQSYTFSLMKVRPGIVTIAPASIKAGSDRLTSNPVTIEVVEGKPKTATTQDGTTHDLFLRAAITDQPVYPGQQVRLDYKVYTTVNVRNWNALKEDDYAQFYYRYIQDFRSKSRLEVVDGVQYTAQTIRSLALFPQQTGTFRLSPMVANLGVALPGSRPDFFFGVRTTPVTATSDSIIIRVLPLPTGAPEEFTGAVGRYAMRAQINKGDLTTDDALVLTLDITGNGDPRRWSPPSLKRLAADFEIYDPKVLLDEAVDELGAIRHRRVLEYLLIPRRTGLQSLRADFHYFDPDSAVYRTLSSPEFQIRVTQGMRSARGEQIYSATSTQQELRGLKPMRASGGGVLLFTPLYFTLLTLPLLGLGAVWWIKRRELMFASLDPAEKKRRMARALAEHYLAEARQHQAGAELPYYDAIARAIFAYLSAKLGIPTSELSKSNITVHLDGLGISRELRDETIRILTACEQMLYAGVSPQSDRYAMYEHTGELIATIEGRAELQR